MPISFFRIRQRWFAHSMPAAIAVAIAAGPLCAEPLLLQAQPPPGVQVLGPSRDIPLKGVEHPSGPESGPWKTRSMRIQGEGSALKLTFACPDPNDHELRAFLKSDIDARAPDFMFHPEQAIAQFPWKWGRSFLWVTPHGYMEMGMVVQRTGPKWHQAINTPKGFGSYLEDMTRREMDKEKTAVHHPGDGYPLWLDLPEETPLNSVLWLCQHIRMSNSSIPDSRYFLAVDESRYLIIYFNFNDETGLSGVRSDWVARAQAMIEKIMATMKAEYEMSGPDSALSHP